MTVDKEVVSSIGKGVLVFAAVAPGDTEKEADSLAAKVLKMKLWDDESDGGKVSISLAFHTQVSSPLCVGKGRHLLLCLILVWPRKPTLQLDRISDIYTSPSLVVI